MEWNTPQKPAELTEIRLLDADGRRVLRIERSLLTRPLEAGLDDRAGLSRAFSELLAALSAELAAALQAAG